MEEITSFKNSKVSRAETLSKIQKDTQRSENCDFD